MIIRQFCRLFQFVGGEVESVLQIRPGGGLDLNRALCAVIIERKNVVTQTVIPVCDVVNILGQFQFPDADEALFFQGEHDQFATVAGALGIFLPRLVINFAATAWLIFSGGRSVCGSRAATALQPFCSRVAVTGI